MKFEVMKLSLKTRWILLYYSVMIYIGMSSAVLGPSLLKLVEQTNSSLGFLSNIFPARAFSYLAGSWLAGILFDKYRGHKLLTIILPVMGITLGLIPFLSNPVGLILVSMIMALATGLADVGCNSLLFKIPDIKIGPAMNGLHLFFGLGSFLAPLILAGSLQLNEGIEWGYWGLALFSLLILIQLIRLKEPMKSLNNSMAQDPTPRDSSLINSRLVWVIALFFFAFVGVEVGYGDWLSTYTVQSGLADETAAILLTSTYFGAFTISRLISIPLAVKIKPKTYLIGDMVGMFIVLGLIFLYPGQALILWIGTIILGFSVASLFPTMLTFAESMMPMTGKITSWFYISGSMGSIVVSWAIGRMVEGMGPIIIIRVISLTLILALVFFLLLLWISKKHPGQSPRV